VHPEAIPLNQIRHELRSCCSIKYIAGTRARSSLYSAATVESVHADARPTGGHEAGRQNADAPLDVREKPLVFWERRVALLHTATGSGPCEQRAVIVYGVAELPRRFHVRNIGGCVQRRQAAQLGGREVRMPPCACVKRCCMRAGLKQLDQHGCSPGPMPSRQDQEHQRLLDHPLGAGL